MAILHGVVQYVKPNIMYATCIQHIEIFLRVLYANLLLFPSSVRIVMVYIFTKTLEFKSRVNMLNLRCPNRFLISTDCRTHGGHINILFSLYENMMIKSYSNTHLQNDEIRVSEEKSSQTSEIETNI